MASTYTTNNGLEKPGVGEQNNTWGITCNTDYDLIDTSLDGVVSLSLSGTTHSLSITDGSTSDGRNRILLCTGTLSSSNTITVTPNDAEKHYYVQNNTTGSQNVIISQGSGSTVTVKPGYSSLVYLDGAGAGAAVKEVLTSLKLTALIEATGAVLVGSTSGTTTVQASAVASGTITVPAATDTLVGKATTDTLTNKTLDTAGTGNVLRINGTQVSAVTGTGAVVLATSPTLVTPVLGTPTSGTLTSCTGLPISTGVSGLGANVATFLGTPSSANLASAVTDETGTGALVFATTPTLVTPVLGTPASGTLTNCTGLPVSTGVSGLGAGVATFLATPSSANLASAVTDETGSGPLVFANSATLDTPTVTTAVRGPAGSVAVPSYSFSGDTNTGMYNTSADSISFSVGGTAKSEINSTYALTGAGPIRSTSGTIDGRIQAGASGAFGVGTFSSDDMLFITNSLERVRIDTSGNVGIGTTSPVTRLQVGSVAGLGGVTGDVTVSAGTNMSYATAANGAGITWNANTNGGYSNTVMSRLLPRQDTSANYNLDVFVGGWNNDNNPGSAIATFQSTGRVGLGVTNPSYQLQLSTDSAAKLTTAVWGITSDARLKTVKRDYDKGLDEICTIRPIVYSYNGKGGIPASDKEHVSVLAQEIQAIFPDTVSSHKGKLNADDAEETDILNFNAHEILFALINSVKELKAEIELLKGAMNG